MAWVIYGKYKENLFTQANPVDFDDNSTTTVKMALVTSSYTPSIDAHDFWDDVSTNEVSGTNYTAGGFAAGNKSVSVPSSGVVTIDADDIATISQSAGGFTNARYAILYKDTGTASTSPVISYYDLTTDRGNVDGDLSFSFDADGIFAAS
jgi:hypothetical protein